MGKSPKEKSSLFRDNGATKTKVAPSDDRALSKVADPDTAHRPLRRKTWVNSRAKTCKEKTRRLFFVLCVLNAILNIFLYFLDVVTDILICITFYQYNYIEWFHWMIVFMVLPYAIAIIGITYYAKLEHRGLRRFTIMICSPVLFTSFIENKEYPDICCALARQKSTREEKTSVPFTPRKKGLRHPRLTSPIASKL